MDFHGERWNENIFTRLINFRIKSSMKKYVAYPQEDFLFTIEKTLSKILKKCVFEQFCKVLKFLNSDGICQNG
jgi:hypothetical protein